MLTLTWSLVEQSVDNLQEALLRIGSVEGAKSQRAFRQKVRLIKKLSKKYLGEKDFLKVQFLCDAAINSAIERNNIVHGVISEESLSRNDYTLELMIYEFDGKLQRNSGDLNVDVEDIFRLIESMPPLALGFSEVTRKIYRHFDA